MSGNISGSNDAERIAKLTTSQLSYLRYIDQRLKEITGAQNTNGEPFVLLQKRKALLGYPPLVPTIKFLQDVNSYLYGSMTRDFYLANIKSKLPSNDPSYKITSEAGVRPQQDAEANLNSINRIISDESKKGITDHEHLGLREIAKDKLNLALGQPTISNTWDLNTCKYVQNYVIPGFYGEVAKTYFAKQVKTYKDGCDATYKPDGTVLPDASDPNLDISQYLTTTNILLALGTIILIKKL